MRLSQAASEVAQVPRHSVLKPSSTAQTVCCVTHAKHFGHTTATVPRTTVTQAVELFDILHVAACKKSSTAPIPWAQLEQLEPQTNWPGLSVCPLKVPVTEHKTCHREPRTNWSGLSVCPLKVPVTEHKVCVCRATERKV